MALSKNISVFGVHSVCAYNPDTFEPYGIARVLGNITMSLSGELVALNGGSNLYPWDVEKGVISTEGSLLLREVPNWSFGALQGADATVNAAEPNGSTTALQNVGGASVVATTGIASVGVKAGSEVDVKSGLCVIKAVSATTVDVFAFTNVDFLRGADLNYIDDSLKINAAPITIATGTDVDIPSIGLELTGGAGTIGMTIGDTAWFDCRSQNTASTEVTVGKSGETIPDIGLFCVAQKKGNAEIFFLDIMRVAASSFPFNFAEQAWMESEVSFQAFRDEQRNGVYRYIRIDGA